MPRLMSALLIATGLALPLAAQTTMPPEIAPVPDATAPDAPSPGDADPADADPKGSLDEGVDLLRRGAKTLLDGLMGEVEPSMRELSEALKNWDFKGLTIDDLAQYHPPEVLPNGDIIIRRKVPLVVEPPVGPNEEVDI